MKRTIWPSAAWISFSTAFRRSSNSPRYLEPASSAPISSAITRRSRSDSGMSPETIRWARPRRSRSYDAGVADQHRVVLGPLERTWIARRISSSRPITGSSFPLSASAVRSRPYFSWEGAEGVLGVGDVTRCGPRTSEIALTRAARSGSSSETPDCFSASASSRCSVEMYSSERPVASSRPAG